jgi:large subunit ribosomal protein L10
MTRAEKDQIIDDLATQIKDTGVFYLADTSELDADSTTQLRRECHKNDIKMTVVKNTLLRIAMERIEDRDYSELIDTLAGPTSILFSPVANAPAKVISNFRKKYEKPVLKGAWIDESIYVGDDQLAVLSSLKSKEELIGDIIALLQSPAKNVISALQSGGNTIAGLVKALEERAA